MFLTPKNGSNITSRSRLFAGQSEEANYPVPGTGIGNKVGQNEQSRRMLKSRKSV